MSPQLADLLRYVNALLALAMVLASCWAVLAAPHWDQRCRFVSNVGFGVLLTMGHLRSLGSGGSWLLPGLTVIVGLSLIGTIPFVRRELRARRDAD